MEGPQDILIAYKRSDIDKLLAAIGELNQQNQKNRQMIESTKQMLENIQENNTLKAFILYSSDIMKCLGVAKTKFHQIKQDMPFLKKDESGKIFAYKNDLLEYIRQHYAEPYYESTKKLLMNTE